MPDDTEEYLSRSAAAKLLGVRENQLRRWEKTDPPRLVVAGAIPAGSLPRVLYRKADVMKLKAERDLLKKSSEVPSQPTALN